MVCSTKLNRTLKVMKRRMTIIGEGLIPTQLGENLQIKKKKKLKAMSKESISFIENVITNNDA